MESKKGGVGHRLWPENAASLTENPQQGAFIYLCLPNSNTLPSACCRALSEGIRAAVDFLPGFHNVCAVSNSDSAMMAGKACIQKMDLFTLSAP